MLNSKTAVAICLLISACSRPMTDGEITYGSQIITRDLNTDLVRFSGQESEAIRSATKQLDAEAEQLSSDARANSSTEELRSVLPSLFGADAMTIGNVIYYDKSVYSSDFSTSSYASDRWLMAHELTHVWHWQNRATTGYTFTKVVSEHLEFGENVYDYALVVGKKFSEYRFEQQGEIVECYAMLRQVEPNSNLTLKHEKLIRAEFPLDEVLGFIGGDRQGKVKVRKAMKQDACGR